MRSERGLSTSNLARRSGLSRAALWKIEQGQVSPTLRTLEKLARALGVPVHDLIEEGTRPTVSAK
jgi:transcriptional regulator with XRE-family HTH domain